MTTTITWPTSLPGSPLLKGYKEGFAKLVISTPTELGPPKLRRRSTAGIKPINVNYLLNKVQLNTFITFFEQTTKSGSLSFLMNHPRTGNSVTMIFAPESLPEWTAISGELYRLNLKIFEMV